MPSPISDPADRVLASHVLATGQVSQVQLDACLEIQRQAPDRPALITVLQRQGLVRAAGPDEDEVETLKTDGPAPAGPPVGSDAPTQKLANPAPPVIPVRARPANAGEVAPTLPQAPGGGPVVGRGPATPLQRAPTVRDQPPPPRRAPKPSRAAGPAGPGPGSDSAPGSDSGSGSRGRPPGLPATIGRYPVIAKLGRGATGTVYRARHPSLPRDVAIKKLHASLAAEPGAVERFRREANALARLDHPGIVRVLEAGQDADGRPFIVTTFVEGESLEEVFEREPPPALALAEIVAELARGIAHAHGRDIIHRDLKPANVLIGKDGRPRLADLGLARALGETTLTATGTSVGTPEYMAPEQVDPRLGEVGPAADVFALGAILYRGVCGDPPFVGASAQATVARLLTAKPEPPRKIDPELPAPLEAIILRCLARQADDRYESATALAQDLDRFLQGEPVLTRSTGAGLARLGRAIRRRPALAIAALLLIGAIVMAALTFLGGRDGPDSGTGTGTGTDTDTDTDTGTDTATDTGTGTDTDTDTDTDTGTDTGTDTAPDSATEQPIGTVVADFLAHGDHVNAVAWSPDGTRIATCGDDGTMLVWDVTALDDGSPERVTDHFIADTKLEDLAWHPDGEHIAFVVSDVDDHLEGARPEGVERRSVPEVRVVRVAGKTTSIVLDGKLSARSSPADAVAWGPDGARLFVAAHRRLRIYDWTPPRDFRSELELDASLRDVAVHADGLAIAASSRVLLVDLEAGRGRSLGVHDESVRAVAWSSDGRLLASASEDGEARVWGPAGATVGSPAVSEREGTIRDLAWRPDTATLATGQNSGTFQTGSIRLWEHPWKTSRLVFEVEAEDESCGTNALAWSPDGSRLAAGFDDGRVRIFAIDR